MEVDGDVRAYDALSKHPRIADLAAISHALLTSAAEARRYDATGDSRARDDLLRLAAERGLSREDAATPLGNAFDVLRSRDRPPEKNERSPVPWPPTRLPRTRPRTRHPNAVRRRRGSGWLRFIPHSMR